MELLFVFEAGGSELADQMRAEFALAGRSLSDSDLAVLETFVLLEFERFGTPPH